MVTFTPAQRKERLDDLIATHNIQIDPKDHITSAP